MARRIVIKVGNIFCAEVEGKYKFYFQFLCRDLTCLNSPVIRVFKRRYPLDANPTMDEIVNGEVCFYAHVVIRWGCQSDIWYKVGTSKELGLDRLNEIWFGLAQEISINEKTKSIEHHDPAENLWIWHVNQDFIKIGHIKKGEELYVEAGDVYPPSSIIKRFMYGHYLGTNDIYLHVKRRPWDDVDTYTKGINGDSNERIYFHFLGEHVVQQVVITPDGREYRLDKAHPREGEYKLLEDDFGDIFWEHKDFITPEEFYSVWN